MRHWSLLPSLNEWAVKKAKQVITPSHRESDTSTRPFLLDVRRSLISLYLNIKIASILRSICSHRSIQNLFTSSINPPSQLRRSQTDGWIAIMVGKIITIGIALILTGKALAAPLVTKLFPDLENPPPSGPVGSAIIINECDYNIWYVNVPEQGRGADVFGLIKPGDNYSVEYDAPQVGHSIKLTRVEDDFTDILQFEYAQTLDNYIDYDVSKVNGNPFEFEGFRLNAGMGCPSVLCESPVDGCKGLYTEPIGHMNPNFYCWLSSSIGLSVCHEPTDEEIAAAEAEPDE